MSDFLLQLKSRIDRNVINNAIGSTGTYEIDVQNLYFEVDGPNLGKLDLGSLDAAYLEAFRKVADACTFMWEAGAAIWRVKRAGNSIDLTHSFVRTDLDTSTSFPAIADGTPLRARFEVPGFEENRVVEIDLWYNGDFAPEDIDALAEIGIALDGNGAEFDLESVGECKLSFSAPESTSGPYVIYDPGKGSIIG